MYPHKVVSELTKERKKFYDKHLYVLLTVLLHEQSHKV